VKRRIPQAECLHADMGGKLLWPSIHIVIETCNDCGGTFAEPMIGPYTRETYDDAVAMGEEYGDEDK
jgi:hypothetical protein